MIAVMSVTNVVTTALGPKARTKLIQLPDESVLVTNDGATILKHLRTTHPAAQRLVRAALQQDQAVGDGTTSVVILAGTLATRTLQFLVASPTPPHILAASFSHAFQHATFSAVEYLQRIALPFDDSSAPALYRRLAQCALRTKSVAHCRELLSELVVQAVLNITSQPGYDIEMDLHIACVLGAPCETSYWLDGLVFEAVVAMPRVVLQHVPSASPHRIVLLRARTSSLPAHSTPTISDEKVWLLHSERLRALSVNFLISEHPLSDHAILCLSQCRVAHIHSVSVHLLYALARCTGASLLSDLGELQATHVGSCEQLRLESVNTVSEEQSVSRIILSHPRHPHRLSTIVLQAPTCDVWQSFATGVNDAVRVVHTAITNTHHIVGGGGSTELALALYLTQCADSLTGPTKEAYLMYAEALETIPYLLAQSAGADPIQTLAALRSAHRHQHELWVGFDSSNNQLVNVLAAGIVEPQAVKHHMLRIAIDAVCDILSTYGFFVDTSLLEKIQQLRSNGQEATVAFTMGDHREPHTPTQTPKHMR